MILGTYAVVYQYGTFDDTLLRESAEEYELDAAMQRQIELDAQLPELSTDVLRQAAREFRTAHGQNIVGIKIVEDLLAYVVIFQGPTEPPATTPDGTTTTYQPPPREVQERVQSYPKVFGNFHRAHLFDIKSADEAFGTDWLEAA